MHWSLLFALTWSPFYIWTQGPFYIMAYGSFHKLTYGNFYIKCKDHVILWLSFPFLTWRIFFSWPQASCMNGRKVPFLSLPGVCFLPWSKVPFISYRYVPFTSVYECFLHLAADFSTPWTAIRFLSWHKVLFLSRPKILSTQGNKVKT